MSDPGPPIRAVVTVLGLDQHEAGALAVAALLRDAGFEVIYAGRFNLPATVAAIASDEDADVVGISCHSWEFLYYAQELAEMLHDLSPPVPVVVGGSVVTASDRDEVLAKGIDAAVLASAERDEIVDAFRRLARQRQGAR
ncbi:cobalamin-dependent protein [Capillimicrobium parvum]|uniref:Pivalyl-CoA mutase small subunit n=1 Tax=Capillimicrobium parvum TaxID=2884022 RepID=A0A9E6Y010_9ACTN|nr:cobalamin-dependent protein [Capillimicrobium parvum]UGS36921.1 Pivalyl-CoA mutase small subunit [Capillimicrobium parvum]